MQGFGLEGRMEKHTKSVSCEPSHSNNRYNQNHAEISFNLLLTTTFVVLVLLFIESRVRLLTHTQLSAHCSVAGGLCCVLAEMMMWLVSRWWCRESQATLKWLYELLVLNGKWPSIYFLFFLPENVEINFLVDF